MENLTSDELRAAVRDVLRDVLPTDLLRGGAPTGAPRVEQVAVGTDAELDALVRRVASLCEDPARRAALRAGHHGFRLAGHATSTSPQQRDGVAPGASAGVLRVERGAVTERTVDKAAADRARLVLGCKAVLTPLGREKARKLGVEIERER